MRLLIAVGLLVALSTPTRLRADDRCPATPCATQDAPDAGPLLRVAARLLGELRRLDASPGSAHVIVALEADELVVARDRVVARGHVVVGHADVRMRAAHLAIERGADPRRIEKITATNVTIGAATSARQDESGGAPLRDGSDDVSRGGGETADGAGTGAAAADGAGTGAAAVDGAAGGAERDDVDATGAETADDADASTALITIGAFAWRAGRIEARDVTVRVDGRSLTAGAIRLHEDQLETTDLRLSACGCPDGWLAPELDVASITIPLDALADDTDTTLETDQMRLRLAGIDLPLWTGPIHDDLRATGLLLPRIGWGERTGVAVEQPVFVRLGRHADLTVGAGWASAIGPLFSLRTRHALDAGTRGDVAARGRYHLDDAQLEVDVFGSASATMLQRLRALALFDLLGRPALHVERVRDLDGRARRYGRSTGALGWDGDRLGVGIRAEVLQPRARANGDVAAPPGELAPLPAALPSAHALPRLDLDALTRPLRFVRFDLAARYVHLETLVADDHLDLGVGQDGRVLDAAPLAPTAPGALDGQRQPTEPLASYEHVLLQTALGVPVPLAGFGTLLLGADLRQVFDVVDAAASTSGEASARITRRTTIDTGLDLTTTLVKPGRGVGHVLRPTLRWRSRALDDRSESDDTLVTATGTRAAEQALELELASTWLTRDWELTARAAAAALAGSGCRRDWCGVVRSRLAATLFDLVVLHGAVSLPSDAPAEVAASGHVELRSERWRFVVGHVHQPGVSWTTGRPAGLFPGEAWLFPLVDGVERAWSDVTDLGVAVTLGAFVGGASTSLVARRDLDVEARLALGLSGDCDCWTAGVAAARHAVAPRWDVLATFRFVPGQTARDEPFFGGGRLW